MTSADDEQLNERVRVNLWIPKSMYDFLEKTAHRDCRSMSDIVRESLRDYIIKDRKSFGGNNNGRD
jgi:metal-responsive CopG/Arc/MetJ family transcriptional regulator